VKENADFGKILCYINKTLFIDVGRFLEEMNVRGSVK
jgi:hypothetical protein